MLTDLLTPLVLAGVVFYACLKKVDAMAALTRGAKEGMRTVARILPNLVILLPAVAMLRASGALDALSGILSPLLSRIGIPTSCVPMMLLRPISGSGALAFATEIIEKFGADSLEGRTAAVMMGATETTLYVITVYFGAAGIRRTRHAIPSALCADLAGFLSAAFLVRLLWP